MHAKTDLRKMYQKSAKKGAPQHYETCSFWIIFGQKSMKKSMPEKT
jgi:hypothetical protein